MLLFISHHKCYYIITFSSQLSKFISYPSSRAGPTERDWVHHQPLPDFYGVFKLSPHFWLHILIFLVWSVIIPFLFHWLCQALPSPHLNCIYPTRSLSVLVCNTQCFLLRSEYNIYFLWLSFLVTLNKTSLNSGPLKYTNLVFSEHHLKSLKGLFYGSLLKVKIHHLVIILWIIFPWICYLEWSERPCY